MIQVTQLKLPVGHSSQELTDKIRSVLGCGPEPFTYEIKRKSLDARHKEAKLFVYTVNVETAAEKKILRRKKHPDIAPVQEKAYHFPRPHLPQDHSRPVIAGSGPAGLFCAWYLARAGLHPLILERGEDAFARKKTVEAFWNGGLLNPESNVQFGEGGAGTFSDGKLNTLVKDPFGRNHEVLLRFVEAGAPSDILYEQKPHLGTDQLIRIITTMRQQIEDMGGEYRFGTRLTGLITENQELTGITAACGTEQMVIPAKTLVLALGHSARDTFEMLEKTGLKMEPKAFAVGLRVEHSQRMINLSQYGEEQNDILQAAAYKVTHICADGRGVYSFCMCPGGYVVNASSEPGHLCINGMSYSARDGRNANSAIIVTVRPEDFPAGGPLGGIEFQRRLEKAAFDTAGGLIPVQRWEDFRKGIPSERFGSILPQMKGGFTAQDVRHILPASLAGCIEEGITAFGRKIPGFDDADTLLSAVESRSSCPLRILRDPETFQASIRGIYPCGEGAGYAGGITSAAMDGIKTAEKIAAS